MSILWRLRLSNLTRPRVHRLSFATLAGTHAPWLVKLKKQCPSQVAQVRDAGISSARGSAETPSAWRSATMVLAELDHRTYFPPHANSVRHPESHLAR
jgi:hypothetical protein